jgi:DNA-binding MarR family transcriptional regulator
MEVKLNQITLAIFSLYDIFIKELYESQKELSVNINGVNIIDESCLDAIYHYESISPSDLSHHLQVTKPAITKMLHKYEGLDLIDKHPSDSDKRSFVVSLKPHVKKRFDETYYVFDQSITKKLHHLGNNEQDTLYLLLNKLIKGLDN